MKTIHQHEKLPSIQRIKTLLVVKQLGKLCPGLNRRTAFKCQCTHAVGKNSLQVLRYLPAKLQGPTLYVKSVAAKLPKHLFNICTVLYVPFRLFVYSIKTGFRILQLKLYCTKKVKRNINEQPCPMKSNIPIRRSN